jgi:hypothetical protein
MTDDGMLVLQSCTVPLTGEYSLCGETSVQSCSDGTAEIRVIIKEEIHIKEEDEPITMSSSSIKEEPEVSRQTFHQYLGLPSVNVPFCLST